MIEDLTEISAELRAVSEPMIWLEREQTQFYGDERTIRGVGLILTSLCGRIDDVYERLTETV